MDLTWRTGVDRARPFAADRSATPGEPSARAGRTAVLYVRGTPFNREHENEVIRALNTLAADGLLEEVAVATWPEKVSYQYDRGSRSQLIETFEAFEAWAVEHDMSICPPFIHREHASAITGERDEVLHTPMMFLAVFEGEEIAEMYPCDHGDEVTTIEDWLARFDEVEASDVRRESRDVERDARPAGRRR